MYSERDIGKLIELTRKYGLEDAECLDKYSFKELQGIFNGIGAESMPKWSRKLVSELHPSLEAVALIHDVEWHETDGKKETFTATNNRFKENGKRIAFGMYGWYNPRRYMVWNQSARFGKLCQMFGWRAFLAGYKNADVESSGVGD